ncbi:primase-helicase family protein [Thalassovita sp.]|uniref:primase-helicase family protein n=1 Tax=Thalassovita sp. TaxID=1979401 RepID=UPI002B2675BB|nr:primase-helicase family protein [Thalassovita sp.]
MKDVHVIDDAEYWNSAELLGQPCPEYDAMLQQEATLTTGQFYAPRDRRNTQDGEWEGQTMRWGDWLEGGKGWGLTRHIESKNKVGSVFVYASTVEKARKAKAVDQIFAMALDFDSGTKLDDILDRIEELGLFAIVSTSHSHGKDTFEISRDDVVKVFGAADNYTDDQIQTFLREHSKHHYDEEFLQTVTFSEVKRTSGGSKIVLKSAGLDKLRVIFPLAVPVAMDALGDTDQAQLNMFESKYVGAGVELLGGHPDLSCTDPCRMMYAPRHPKGADWYAAVARGRPLTFEEIPTLSKRDYTKRLKGPQDAFTVAGEGADTDKLLTPSGRNLKALWHDIKDRLMIADLIESECPDKLRDPTGVEGKIQLECPFERDHSEEGGNATFAVNALDSDKGNFVIRCNRNSCKSADHGTLDFLAEMLRQEWFEEDLLNDDSPYMLEPGEEVQEQSQVAASVSNSDAGADAAFCADIRAPLYDELLVDGEGFVRASDAYPVLYDKYGIKAGASDEAKQKAYKAAVNLIRDQIKESMRVRFSYVVFPKGGARGGVRTAPGAAVRWYDEGGLDRLFRNREVSYYTENGKGEPKVEKLKPSVLFMYDRARDTYGRTVYEPAPEKAAEAARNGDFNLWTGFAVEPVEGDWSLLRTHLKEVLCDNDDELFHWVLTYIASTFVRPGVKVPSSIAVTGEQGTGKSKVWDWIREALGCNAIKVTQPKHITGNFNEHLDGKLLMVAEEAFWAGDKSAGGVLKDIISGDKIPIEPKFENMTERPNYMSSTFISNNDWIIPTDEEDARRFLVLRASEAHKEDAPYFAKIDAQMKDGGLEAMVYELTHWNPEAVNLTWDSLRTPPKTEYLRQQVGMGLSGPLAMLVDALEEGVIQGRTASGEAFYYDLSDTETTPVAKTHMSAFLGIKKGRGNETAEGVKAIKTLFGEDAVHDNKEHVTYEGSPDADGVRSVITTGARVRFVPVPPLGDLKEVLARYGRG